MQDQHWNPDWTNTTGIAKHTGLSVAFFNKDRHTRLLGVPFVKLGKMVLYNIPIVDAFLKTHLVYDSGNPAVEEILRQTKIEDQIKKQIESLEADLRKLKKF